MFLTSWRFDSFRSDFGIFYQSGDLSFKKGEVIVVKEMSDSTDTWYFKFHYLFATLLIITLKQVEREVGR